MKSNTGIAGFTVVELIVVMFIVLTLFGLTWINFTPLPSRTSSQASASVVLADIKSQQTQAMSGEQESDYGVRFESTNYILLPDNFSVSLEDVNLAFTDVTLPDSTITFTKRSGETTPGSFSITNNLTGEVKTFRLNKYGATY